MKFGNFKDMRVYFLSEFFEGIEEVNLEMFYEVLNGVKSSEIV